jgi:hypothetical protein
MLNMRLPSLAQILGQGNPKHGVEVLPAQKCLVEHPVPTAPWGGIGSPPPSHLTDMVDQIGQKFLPNVGLARNLPNSQGFVGDNFLGECASETHGNVEKEAIFDTSLGGENSVFPKSLEHLAEIGPVRNNESGALSSFLPVDPPGGVYGWKFGQNGHFGGQSAENGC